MCTCDDDPVNADQICSQECRRAAWTIYYDTTLETLVVVDPDDDSNTEALDFNEDSSFMGRMSCASDTCSAKSMNMNAGSFDGIYGLSDGILDRTTIDR